MIFMGTATQPWDLSDLTEVFSVLSAGLPVDAANAAGITALSEAAAAGKAEAAQLLLDRKAGCG